MLFVRTILCRTAAFSVIIAAASLAIPAGATTCSTVSACIFGDDSASGPGVEGESSSGYGLEGISKSGVAILGSSTSGDGIDGKTDAAGTTSSNARSGIAGLDISTSSTFNSGVYGYSAKGVGVKGVTGAGTALAASALANGGTALSATAKQNGIVSTITGLSGTAITAVDTGNSSSSITMLSATSTGGNAIEAESGNGYTLSGGTGGTAVSADDNSDGTGLEASSQGVGAGAYIGAGYPYPDSRYVPVLEVDWAKDYSPSPVFSVPGLLSIDEGGTLTIAGTLVQNGSPTLRTHTTTGQTLKMYAARQPQDTVEDVGEAHIVSGNGAVALDPKFASTVDVQRPYYVFLTPEGDNRGLYIAAKNAHGFVIKESMGGHSTLAVQYRIVASAFDDPASRLALETSTRPLPDAAESRYLAQVRAHIKDVRARHAALRAAAAAASGK